jgi:hypothetical protein
MFIRIVESYRQAREGDTALRWVRGYDGDFGDAGWTAEVEQNATTVE